MPSLRYWFSKIRNRMGHVMARVSEEISAPAVAMEREVLRQFHAEEVGKEYGITAKAKQRVVQQIMAAQHIPAATKWIYHVVLAREILSIPKSVPGDVIECGCYKGASTASLSLACSLVGRKLLVCDSFEGLPEDEGTEVHEYPHLGVYGHYDKGMYAGALEEVKGNITRYGNVDVCEFVKGYFCDSLPGLDRPIALAFADVDLVSSMLDCIRHIWPLLADGGFFYTDDSCDMEVVRTWFDDAWWREHLGERSPGYVGSGCGLPLGATYSSLGYARKVKDPTNLYGTVPWLRYDQDDSK